MDETTKNFIKDKVTKLGSIETVKFLYDKDCVVDSYAIAYSYKLFKKGGNNDDRS